MTAVGERTKRIVLGTSVMTPTFRYNPAVVAQAFATMGCLYPGRIMLGVGTGEALNEIATGYTGEWPEFKERFARLRESVQLMRELWLGERVDFEGEYYHTKGASIYDVPEGGIPVYIAAGGPVVAKYAGRAGDGFICTSGKGEELYTDKLMPAVHEGAETAGRDVDDIDKMIEIKISYDTDPEAGAGEHPVLGAAVADRRAEAQHRRPDRDGDGRRRAADRAGRQALDRGVGSRRGGREGRATTSDTGLNHLVFHAPGHDQRRFLELFERDLAPRLRTSWADVTARPSHLHRLTGGRHRQVDDRAGRAAPVAGHGARRSGCSGRSPGRRGPRLHPRAAAGPCHRGTVLRASASA